MSPDRTFDAEGEPIEIGDIVQIDPESDVVFGGCLLTVAELLGYGVHGFVSAPDPAGPIPYFYRAESKNFRRIGRSVFRIPEA